MEGTTAAPPSGSQKKVALLLGAGATVADVTARSPKTRPPLDKGFFKLSRPSQEVDTIASHIDAVYGIDIFNPKYDSLEGVMARVYTDIYDPGIGINATEAFRCLIRVFNRSLARTTNNITATQRRYLYRLLVRFLEEGVSPSNMTLITFNQDLQIEKVLYKLQSTKKWSKKGTLFSFPRCYMLKVDSSAITAPTDSKNQELFDIDNSGTIGIRILKLHGSLNWYSTHRGPKLSPTAMFDPRRKLRITRRRLIDPDMKLRGKHKRVYTLPVVVPPVTHKSGILHQSMKRLWTMAESALAESDDLIIFGYSCSVLDFESSNLIHRAIRRNARYHALNIIDPDSNVAKRYIDLIGPPRVRYFQNASVFLSSA